MAKIYFKYGAMNSGKSTALIQCSFNYKQRGMETLRFKPKVDTRDEDGFITSRVGLKTDCIMLGKGDSVLDMYLESVVDPIEAVLIDEAQFLTVKQVEELVVIAKLYDTPVLCYGLKNDFSMTLFEASAKLLAVAESLEELKTVCWCGDKATQNARVDASGAVVYEGESVVVGDIGLYVPLCLDHYAQGMSNPNVIRFCNESWGDYLDRVKHNQGILHEAIEAIHPDIQENS
ncbi:MAG: thymidine kinase [Clostridium sp.]|uniref:thymidine kinase n=1 Tax=Clostridium sp. TaxID=1506 RepID=UPI003EE7A486